ncbi:hypothetical protein TSUD_240320 [Trifolium subterraneum]|uniref:GST C-terminal domain-containing protein n=1 Tax=Trifolium subterraneum TaxID=3900 RepID=A0A2Z6NFF0_TRISU|nr:hypothetical protein TSUD_240320 [Trifolium subterraneum]
MFIQIIPSSYGVLQFKGEERKKAIEDMVEILQVFKEGIKVLISSSNSSTASETLGLLDIVVAATCCTYKAFYEACNIEIFTPEMTPNFFRWVNALKEHPLVKETLPPHDKLVAKLKSIIGN